MAKAKAKAATTTPASAPTSGQDQPGAVKDPQAGAEAGADPSASPESDPPVEFEPTLPVPPQPPYDKVTDMDHPRLNAIMVAAHITHDSQRDDLIAAVEAIQDQPFDHPAVTQYKAEVILWLKNL